MAEDAKEEGPILFLKVTSLPEGLDKQVSKGESNCKICGIPFTKKGVSQTSKHVCRFCYHAICASCSPLTALHPETGNSERICLHCYAKYLKEDVVKENEEKTKEILKHEIDKFQRESVALHNEELIKIIEERANLERSYKEHLNRLTREIQERDSKIMTLSVTLEEPKKEKEQEKEKGKEKTEDSNHAEVINKMRELDIENQNLKKEVLTLKTEITTRKTVTAEPRTGCCSSCTIQ